MKYKLIMISPVLRVVIKCGNLHTTIGRVFCDCLSVISLDKAELEVKY